MIPIVPALLKWFAANARDLPWRRTSDPYAVWVSEIMLQQTQVKTVIPYWERWMAEMPTIQAVANAKPSRLHKLWEGLGYYTRVRNLQKAAQEIVARHGGKFPEKFEDVLALSGIGRYTAGAICSIAFDQPAPIVDGNVIRVLSRVFGIRGPVKDKATSAEFWRLAGELVGSAGVMAGNGNCSALNQSLMELGALVCVPRSPVCGECPMEKFCVARKLGLQEELPNLGKRERATARRFAAVIVERRGRYLVRQRPAGVVNALMWEFPNMEVPIGKKIEVGSFVIREGEPARARGNSVSNAASAVFEIRDVKAVCTIKHSITRYRITLEAFRAKAVANLRMSNARWLTPAELNRLTLPSAHKKILRVIEHGTGG
jgi:A/G-specific adenine glycosylase